VIVGVKDTSDAGLDIVNHNVDREMPLEVKPQNEMTGHNKILLIELRTLALPL